MTASKLAPAVLGGLKDFQRATVEYVYSRLYDDVDPVHRFLVADEVGLGKTLVARGLIAKTIDHLRDRGVRRIDVIYICSNADIAAQNIRRLNVTGSARFDLATRITLLPTRLQQLKSAELNFVSFTPGTSFEMGQRSGRQDERALLYWLLRHAWGSRRLRHPGVFRLLRGGAREDRFAAYVQNFSPRVVGRGASRIDSEVADRFKRNLEARAEIDRAEGRQPLRDRFESVADRLRRRDRGEVWGERQALVGELRSILARSCIDALEPDLIILDEFQRFRHLLEDPTDDDDVRTLARQLFDYESDDGHARTLLLSATPYKMYTLSSEAGEDDHYADFVKTTEFLLGRDEAGAFGQELRAYREALLDAGGLGPEALRRRKRAVEHRLRRVMTRTERLAVTPDRSGMLNAVVENAADVRPVDLESYVTLDGVSRDLQAAGDSVEYWKSSPYPLSFMEAYDVKKRLRDARQRRDAAVALVANRLVSGAGLLDPDALEAYEAVDPGNARLRAFVREYLDPGAWRLLWLPPSLAYYPLRGDFGRPAVRHLTKRLIFSSWTVVPQALASVLSYEAERRMMAARKRDQRNTPEARKRIRTPLGFRRVGDRAASMTTFLLMYPSIALAELGDPLAISEARRNGAPSAEYVLRDTRTRIETALGPVIAETSDPNAPVDDNWYWAAPLLLDRARYPGLQDEFVGIDPRSAARAWAEDQGVRDRDDVDGLALHVARARAVLAGVEKLGAPPADLGSTLAQVAVASPAICALRALSRGAPEPDIRLLRAAARVAWGFRSLFGIPEVMALVRGRTGTENAYWRRVLSYCLDGCLQAVLDEYAHVLPDWQGLLQQPPAHRAAVVAQGMYEALTIRAPLYGYDAIKVVGDDVDVETKRLRARFALRFGVDATDEESDVQRSTQVRAAFNSPFWPFVLITTSIGQEGLDFHLYCHAVVHWNLPANPVDLEQREGRVHRYKGHAVRRNVAAAHARHAHDDRRDPWELMFEAAKGSRKASGRADLVPYWIYDGRYHIERHVPVFPLSREIERYERLRKSLAAYRLVFGQPRQEDLVAYLSEHLSPEELRRRMRLLRIDLSPPRAPDA